MLFTDIEGSTRLAQKLGGSWPDALTVHHRILRAAIERHRGYVADTEGDAFFAVFAQAEDAIAAALEAQRELRSAAWPCGIEAIKVRMGVHTGVVEHRELGYVGIEIHRAARVGSAANGGQVLLTGATQALLDGSGVALEYVGEHRLKDFPRPLQLFHLVIDGRQASEFSALCTALARPTNLREDLRPLVGRERELDQLRRLLRSGERLVTVTGAGGAGKTRLALAAARLMLDEMPGGAFLASLASVNDPAELLDTVARALELTGTEGAPWERITARVRDRPTLLVLDNFEQLLPAAPLVSRLVAGAPELRVLVTSQAPLRVAGELVMSVDALPLEAAAELFVELRRRAASGRPSAVEDRDAILEICRRVGCLPLAVELAAARTSVLAPAQLLARLERSSDVLRSVARDAPERQRSLRATFEWTSDLLAPGERLLFRRLGVFAGPVALEVIESVCETPESGEPLVALDALEGLLEFSLLRREESATHGVRFTMPQALRDLALGELAGSPEAEVLRRRHAEHVLAVAEPARIWFTADPVVTAPVVALDAEIRPALAWASTEDPELYRRLLCALALGLIRRGNVAEALAHTTRVCAAFAVPSDAIDAWLANCRAYALLMSGRLAEGETAIEPAVAFYRAHGEPVGLGLALHTAGWLAADSGDRARALSLARESLELLRSTGDPALTGRGLALLIQVLIYGDAVEEAERFLAEATVAITDPESDLASGVATLSGDLALLRGDAATALAHFVESLKLAARRGDGVQIINDAYCIAHALALSGHPEAALEAAGVAGAIAADGGHNAVHYADLEAVMSQARHAVGPAAAALAARGREVAPGERVARLLALASSHRDRADPQPT